MIWETANDERFSALQRAENSSHGNLQRFDRSVERFSALQRAENSSHWRARREPAASSVSVLFSEPKIPHSSLYSTVSVISTFQCSSASRKFLTSLKLPLDNQRELVSVLFSEPKIPHGDRRRNGATTRTFQCSSASRKFLTDAVERDAAVYRQVSVLFSEPKIPHPLAYIDHAPTLPVSVLFSEPKIPHLRLRNRLAVAREGFSALQRAENSSLSETVVSRCTNNAFQCSSASRKFLTLWTRTIKTRPASFQCSSASRKFLTGDLGNCIPTVVTVSVLFSEPKIPHRPRDAGFRGRVQVSVLFSEPKIPHLSEDRREVVRIVFQCSSASRKFLTLKYVFRRRQQYGFSALQRAENSSRFFPNSRSPRRNCFSALQRAENSSRRALLAFWQRNGRFQCSSASRKFLTQLRRHNIPAAQSFSALQRAENSSRRSGLLRSGSGGGFSALQRAENSSQPQRHRSVDVPSGFSALQRAENSSPAQPPPEPRRCRRFSALQRAENSSLACVELDV